MKRADDAPSTSAGREVVIEVKDLRTRFGTQVVHDGVDLEVYRGEVLGVIGGSGAGKSVLLRAILGLKEPDAGSVRMFGQETTHLDAEARRPFERRIGLLFQDGALFTSLTVLENVRLPLVEFFQLPPDFLEQLALLKIRLTGLPSDAAHKYPSQLSGGMRKRAGLARALALDPELLFLDEPTSGLDPIAAAEFDNLIRTLTDALGLTVFLVTHDMDSIYTLCDRVAVLADKKVVVADTLEQVERNPHPWIRQCFQGPRARQRPRNPGDGAGAGVPAIDPSTAH
jgi:phospholipid/cholesterol/gamma-HCH transport system ATP-binding protein